MPAVPPAADAGQRPSPEALLEELRRERRGRLKIFLGAAPGVGKTYAMLNAARQRRSDGVDVVVAVVETHGRLETEALLRGLELIPRQRVEYRGLHFEELDLDAVLRRRPALAVVDELAHTNLAGCRHPKRHQDVRELLDAGIDVYTTLNIQHVESLNDVVARITGVRVRETLPDTVLQVADELEVIDLPPPDLIRRMSEGKVYVPAEARRAMHNFFTPGNLTALRELALRWAAERVDADMLRYMQAHAIQGPWPARERVMVCIGADPIAEHLVRTARRVAQRRKAPWLAVHVETLDAPAPDDPARARIAKALRLAEELGAETVVLHDDRVAQAILACARSRNVSQIIVGRSRRPGWARLLRRSPTDTLVGRGQSFNVMVVADAPDQSAAPASRGRLRSRRRRLEELAGLAAGLAGPLLAWAAADAGFQAEPALLLAAGVLVAGALGGAVAGLPALAVGLVLAALERGIALPPPDPLDLAELAGTGLALLAAAAGGLFVYRLRRLVRAGRRTMRRTANLYDFTRRVAAAVVLDDVLWAVVHHVASTVRGRALVLLPRDGALAIAAGYPPEDRLDATSTAAAEWVWTHGSSAGHGSDTLPAAPWLFLALATGRGRLGVLGVQISEPGRALPPEETRLLEALASQAAVAIERTTLATDIEQARLLTETEKLRTALLSSVSGELRAPLAVITGSVTGLLEYGADFDEEERRELLQTIHLEAERLNRAVQNLVGMTRLDAGGLHPQPEWVELAEIINAALARLEPQLGAHSLRLELAPELPLLQLDFLLMEQVLVNLLDNACRFTAPASAITVRAGLRGDRVELAVIDQGPGLPEAERARLFEAFGRRPHSPAGGSGMGLALCRGIVEAHGGTIGAATGPDGTGTAVVISLPLLAPPPLPAHLDDGSAAAGGDSAPRTAHLLAETGTAPESPAEASDAQRR